MQYLLNYFLIAIIVGLVLKYAPGVGMDDKQIVSTILIALGIVILSDVLFVKRSEGMGQIDLMDMMSKYKGGPIVYDDPRPIRAMDEDEFESRLRHGYLDSDPARLHYGEFSEDLRGRTMGGDRISMDELQSLMCQSKMDSFARQRNLHKFVPETQVGKDRSHLNWQKLY